MEENVQAQRLLAATAAAFGPLATYGFRVEGEPDPLDWRGATVEVASATVTFTIMADWLDNHLGVWVTVAGAKPVTVEALIPELSRIRRIPRSPTRGALQRRLERVVQAVQEQAPDLLRGDGRALDRVRQAGAEAERF